MGVCNPIEIKAIMKFMFCPLDSMYKIIAISFRALDVCSNWYSNKHNNQEQFILVCLFFFSSLKYLKSTDSMANVHKFLEFDVSILTSFGFLRHHFVLDGANGSNTKWKFRARTTFFKKINLFFFVRFV